MPPKETGSIVPPPEKEGPLSGRDLELYRTRINDLCKHYVGFADRAAALYEKGKSPREVYEELHSESLHRARKSSDPSLRLVALSSAMDPEGAEHINSVLEEARRSSVSSAPPSNSISSEDATIPPPRKH